MYAGNELSVIYYCEPWQVAQEQHCWLGHGPPRPRQCPCHSLLSGGPGRQPVPGFLAEPCKAADLILCGTRDQWPYEHLT